MYPNSYSLVLTRLVLGLGRLRLGLLTGDWGRDARWHHVISSLHYVIRITLKLFPLLGNRMLSILHTLSGRLISRRSLGSLLRVDHIEIGLIRDVSCSWMFVHSESAEKGNYM